MKSLIRCLDEAIELISADGGFCKGTFCRDAKGEEVVFNAINGTHYRWGYSAPPVSFCLEGVLGYVTGYFKSTPEDKDVNSVYRQWNELVRAVALHGMPPDYCYPVLGGYLTPLSSRKPRDFNDRESTSQEDAVLALKRTRSYLEEQVR
jgi:hypothetical protein